MNGDTIEIDVTTEDFKKASKYNHNQDCPLYWAIIRTLSLERDRVRVFHGKVVIGDKMYFIDESWLGCEDIEEAEKLIDAIIAKAKAGEEMETIHVKLY